MNEGGGQLPTPFFVGARGAGIVSDSADRGVRFPSPQMRPYGTLSVTTNARNTGRCRVLINSTLVNNLANAPDYELTRCKMCYNTIETAVVR